MKDSLSKFGIALAMCLVELALVKFGQFAFGGLIVIFLLIGGLMVLMGHKSLGWGMVLGTIVFTLVLLLLGWTFMDGWPGPQEFMDGKRYIKQ
jgi:membrane protein implicated in regulation of membrane protease activity